MANAVLVDPSETPWACAVSAVGTAVATKKTANKSILLESSFIDLSRAYTHNLLQIGHE